MANEVPDVVVPEVLVERMRATSRPEAGLDEGTQIARELLAALRPMIAGAVVSAPQGESRTGAGSPSSMNAASASSIGLRSV